MFAAGAVVPGDGDFSATGRSESHRATRLGNTATSFAPTIYSPADLRARFASPDLHPDFVKFCDNGAGGNADDLSAPAHNEICRMGYPRGRHYAVYVVAGKWPADLLAGCDLGRSGPDSWLCLHFQFRRPSLALCDAKTMQQFFCWGSGAWRRWPRWRWIAAYLTKWGWDILCRSALSLHNLGNIPETNISVVLPIPATAIVTDTTENGTVANESVSWTISDLPVDGVKQKSHA